MRWAVRRQFLYALSILITFGLIGIGLWFGFFYRAPSCFDGIQNGDETGIDCGGSCARLCQAPRVSALWARAVPVAPGVYHATALIQNPESNAGTTALPYTFLLYDADNILVAERRGTMYLGPGEVVPLFEPNIETGNRIPVHTYVNFSQAVWEKMSPEAVPISIVSQNLDQDILKLTTHIKNMTALSVPKVTITAFLYDANGVIVDASQTILADIAPREEKDVIFTWQESFTSPVTRVEIVPRVH